MIPVRPAEEGDYSELEKLSELNVREKRKTQVRLLTRLKKCLHLYRSRTNGLCWLQKLKGCLSVM